MYTYGSMMYVVGFRILYMANDFKIHCTIPQLCIIVFVCLIGLKTGRTGCADFH